MLLVGRGVFVDVGLAGCVEVRGGGADVAVGGMEVGTVVEVGNAVGATLTAAPETTTGVERPMT
jgi:predicted small secreted protein